MGSLPTQPVLLRTPRPDLAIWSRTATVCKLWSVCRGLWSFWLIPPPPPPQLCAQKYGMQKVCGPYQFGTFGGLCTMRGAGHRAMPFAGVWTAGLHTQQGATFFCAPGEGRPRGAPAKPGGCGCPTATGQPLLVGCSARSRPPTTPPPPTHPSTPTPHPSTLPPTPTPNNLQVLGGDSMLYMAGGPPNAGGQLPTAAWLPAIGERSGSFGCPPPSASLFMWPL